MSFSDRLKELMEDPKKTSAFARKCGLGEASIRQYLNGGTPGIDKAEAIAHANGVSLEWLITGRGEKTPHVLLPAFDAEASAKAGKLVLGMPQGDDGVTLDFLQRHRIGGVETLFACASYGDGMEPAIMHDDIVILTRAVDGTERGHDGIYLVLCGSQPMLNRIAFLGGGRVRVTSDNAAYAANNADLALGTDIKLLGKALFTIGVRRI